jgi:hypothetical protein
MARSPLFRKVFEWTKTRIFARDHPETWFFSARTWPQTASTEQQANALAGDCMPTTLFSSWTSLAAFLTRLWWLRRAASPRASGRRYFRRETRGIRAGPSYRAATVERHLWHFIEITGDPDDPNRSPRINLQWAKEQIDKYGRDNPWVLVKVFGKFPPASLDSLLGLDEVQDAMRRDRAEHEHSFAARVLGVDAARFGDDPWIIFPRQGLTAFKPIEMRGPRTQEAAARIATAWERWSADACFVDDTGGYGDGAIDSLLTLNYFPTPINFSGKATNPRYYNKRSEMHFELAQ